MTRFSLFIVAMTTASPVLAAGKDYGLISLRNTDFVVALGFLVFIGILVYFKVPGIVMGLLDKRAESIQSELDEARALREEAQSLLAGYERQVREAEEQARRIVTAAREEAEAAAEAAKADMAAAVARRLEAAEGQIALAEAKAVKEVRDRAIAVAVGAAQEVVAAQMDDASASALIDASISEVGARLN
jgi:F-type H+-transporting ATPase subunit b